MAKYKLFIQKYRHLEKESLYRHSQLTEDEYYISIAFTYEYEVDLCVYNVDAPDVSEYGPDLICNIHLTDEKAQLFNKLFMNDKYVITYDQYKDVIKRSGKGPLEIRFWYIDYSVSGLCFSNPQLQIIFRDLESERHEYYAIYDTNDTFRYIDLIKPLVLREINLTELRAIKALSPDTYSCITKEECKYYSNMNREEAIKKLARKCTSIH